MTFAERRRAALLEAQAPKCAGCPRPLEFIECPHGCGLKYYAPDQRLTSEQFWRHGPWRMSIHLAGRRAGSRCVRPLFDGPVSFTIPTADEPAGEHTTTEEEKHGLGSESR